MCVKWVCKSCGSHLKFKVMCAVLGLGGGGRDRGGKMGVLMGGVVRGGGMIKKGEKYCYYYYY